MSEQKERLVHVIFGDNTTPEVDANTLNNNDLIENFVFDLDSFFEDFEEEFGRTIPLDTFNSFITIGDIVRWVEAE